MRFLKTRWVVLTLLCRNHSIARAFLAVPTGRAIGASLPSIHSEIPVQATPRVSRGDVVFDRAPTSVSDRTYRSSTLLGATPIHAAELDEPEAIQDASSADNVGGGEQKLTGNVSTARPYEGVKASPPQPSMCNEELHSGAEVAQTESTEENSMGTDGFMENMMDNVGGVSPISRRADGQLEVDGQGLLNLCILVASALWVVHLVFTVDATIWRGWTFQETMMRIPYDNWGNYETGLVEHPMLTKTVINVVIYLLGDWLSQVNWGRVENRQLWEFDLQRTLRNGLIGALFGPLVHYYYDFSDHVLPPSVPINRPFKILMDQSIYFCSKCTMYIALVSWLRGDRVDEIKETVKEKVPRVVTTGWRFWPFVHVFTYFLVPPRHRVLWVNCVDLLWSSILAGMTSASVGDAQPVETVGPTREGDVGKKNSSKIAAVTAGGQGEP